MFNFLKRIYHAVVTGKRPLRDDEKNGNGYFVHAQRAFNLGNAASFQNFSQKAIDCHTKTHDEAKQRNDQATANQSLEGLLQMATWDAAHLADKPFAFKPENANARAHFDNAQDILDYVVRNSTGTVQANAKHGLGVLYSHAAKGAWQVFEKAAAAYENCDTTRFQGLAKQAIDTCVELANRSQTYKLSSDAKDAALDTLLKIADWHAKTRQQYRGAVINSTGHSWGALSSKKDISRELTAKIYTSHRQDAERLYKLVIDNATNRKTRHEAAESLSDLYTEQAFTHLARARKIISTIHQSKKTGLLARMLGNGPRIQTANDYVNVADVAEDQYKRAITFIRDAVQYLPQRKTLQTEKHTWRDALWADFASEATRLHNARQQGTTALDQLAADVVRTYGHK